MKKILITALVIMPGILLAQQMPVSENYFMDKYTLSSSYAGHFNPGSFFTSFRTDWTGIDGGPKTIRVSYSDLLMTNAAYGGKIIFDKAGIFNQLYVMGTYSYSLKVTGDHRVLLALSAGLYHNKLNFSEYYNDPNYDLDPALTYGDASSKLKFMSDFSVLYLFKGIEAGIMFANISFGEAKYDEVDVTYKPMANFQAHAAYTYRFNEKWSADPLLYIRGGRYIKSQFGLAARVTFLDKIWGCLAFRDPGIWGVGFGAEITKAIQLSYSFNFASSVSTDIFNTHEIGLGLNMKKLLSKNE
jgi:type IX secretion system PorP/SprF family membrane protein